MILQPCSSLASTVPVSAWVGDFLNPAVHSRMEEMWDINVTIISVSYPFSKKGKVEYITS